jgi:hypothetical protein
MNTVSPTSLAMRILFLVTLVAGVATLAPEASFMLQGLNPSVRGLNIGSTLLQIAAVLQLGLSGFVQETLGKTIFKPKYKVSNLPVVSAEPGQKPGVPVRLRDMLFQNALFGFTLIGVSGAVRLYATYL